MFVYQRVPWTIGILLEKKPGNLMEIYHGISWDIPRNFYSDSLGSHSNIPVGVSENGGFTLW
jgi:hypothetical protein